MSNELKGTILIVDDEPNVVWFISKVCRPRGYETITAGSGEEALKYVEELDDKIDLILLDLNMPGMGGMAVLKTLSEKHNHIPVIILTALHDKREECEKLGIEGFMKKPYSLEDLYEKIEQVCERRQEDKAEVEVPEGMAPAANVLIVDDDTDVCELLSAALFEDVDDAFYKTKWAKSGAEALEISHEFKPDIAIVDIKMPKMWGDELVRRFEAGEGYCPRDFVIYTSITNPDEAKRAKGTGYKFLSKPTNIEVLFESLKKICVKHHLLVKKDSALETE